MLNRTIICSLLLCTHISASEVIDRRTVTLGPGEQTIDAEVTLRGGRIESSAASSLTGRIELLGTEGDGIAVSVVGRSLRSVRENDWRETQTIVGRRIDQQIDFTGSMGTAAEHAAWDIGGTPTDWDAVSIQWDGHISIPEDGYQLATTSDDGSRLWLDGNDNGQIDRKEWRHNGWGQGQGSTRRRVSDTLKAGVYRFRLQWEEGGGGNNCTLSWRPGRGPWTTVPAEAFIPGARLTMAGPIHCAATISGRGSLILEDGVELATVPQVDRLVIQGSTRINSDLDLSQTALVFADDGQLTLDSYACLTLAPGSDTGRIHLNEGTLRLLPGRHPLQISGRGCLEIIDPAAGSTDSGEVELDGLGDQISVSGGSAWAADRCVTSTRLLAPLTTTVPCSRMAPGARQFIAILDVPTGLPDDLAVSIGRANRQGRLFQQTLDRPLPPGRTILTLSLDGRSPLVAQGHHGIWNADAAADAERVTLFLTAADPATSDAPIRIDTRLIPSSDSATSDHGQLHDIHLPATATCGQRWQLQVVPEPYPDNPYDTDDFALDLLVTGPDGQTTSYAGFHDQPVEAIDRGDLAVYRDTAPPRFLARFRPTQPGSYHLRLQARWGNGEARAIDLGSITASGEPWDDIVRVDQEDPRFFSAGGRFVWPAGCNLNSTYDVRSESRLATQLTVDRGPFTREAFLKRLAAGGGNGCEVWLSPWNLGLEWTPRWPGFRGHGRYNSGNAEGLERFLALAEELGVRVTISIFNHGMARAGNRAEHDWRYHPYNVDNGGWLDDPEQLFTDEQAFAHQQRYFRYLAGRFGDSPAILGWKLWAEVNLANADKDLILAWHERASEALDQADPWGHPITTHWSGTWRTPDQRICALPGIDWITIDAYKGDNVSIANLLADSSGYPRRPDYGLAHHNKPLLVAEFGGSAGATAQERLRIEHTVGPWVGMVSGHAGSPMLWWFEWIDQHELFGVYRPLQMFMDGEDLRDPRAISHEVTAIGTNAIWCRAWTRPGRMLGYVVDNDWVMNQGARALRDLHLRLANDAAAGPMQLEWWNPDDGSIISTTAIDHHGGELRVDAPPFHRHLAFKLSRVD